MPGGRPLEMPPPRPPSMWARSARRSAALWRDWERPLRTTGRWRGSPESAYLAVRQLSTTTLPKPRSRADRQTPASPGGDQSTVKYSGGWAEAVYPNGSTPAPNDVGSDGRSDSVADDISGHGRRRSAHDTQHQLNGHSNGAEHADGPRRVVRMLDPGLDAEQQHRSEWEPPPLLNVHGQRVQRILTNGANPEGVGWAEAKRLFLGTTADGRGYEQMSAAEKLQWEQESTELQPQPVP